MTEWINYVLVYVDKCIIMRYMYVDSARLILEIEHVIVYITHNCDFFFFQERVEILMKKKLSHPTPASEMTYSWAILML